MILDIIAQALFIWFVGSIGFGLGWWVAYELGAQFGLAKALFASASFVVFAILAHDIVAT